MHVLSNSGVDLQFDWEEVDAFVRQPDGTLFSWCERFRFYRHLIYGIVSPFLFNTFVLLHLSFFFICFLVFFRVKDAIQWLT